MRHYVMLAVVCSMQQIIKSGSASVWLQALVVNVKRPSDLTGQQF